jgi:uncharacterized protein (DUF4415 family)
MRRSPIRPDAENPEWTEEDFRAARPALEVLPEEVVEAIRRYRGQRGPQKSPTKQLISLRLDRDVVAALRSTGAGWQTRANEALRGYVTRNRLRGGASKRTRSKAVRAVRRRPKV